MKRTLKDLVRPTVRDLIPYSSARDEYTGSGAILLDANENPFNEPYNRYPDPHQRELKKRIGKLKGIDSQRIFLGNGSDEAIDLLFRVFCEPGEDNVVTIAPTYGMYRVAADINNVAVRNAQLKPDFSLDTTAIEQAVDDRTKLLFICSPNNPTSNSFDPEELLDLAKQLDTIVVVDEAYIDFSVRESLILRGSKQPNVVVLQTFSKAWALAGIRLGMAVADPYIIHMMSKVKYPYNLNLLTQQFALDALENEREKDRWVETILKERANLAETLLNFTFVEQVYPSDANFLLVRMTNPVDVYTFLVEKRIIVRDRSQIELCKGSLRITIGTGTENRLLVDALVEYQRHCN
jgi:histidinol-phosphate aminotransferase